MLSSIIIGLFMVSIYLCRKPAKYHLLGDKNDKYI